MSNESYADEPKQAALFSASECCEKLVSDNGCERARTDMPTKEIEEEIDRGSTKRTPTSR
jgi:hypothetical protein